MESDEFRRLTLGILNELSGNIIYKSDTAQNHLFGCLSLIEMLDDGSAILDRNYLNWQDTSNNLNIFDISASFHLIGCQFGFLDRDLIGFHGFSDSYMGAWMDLLTVVSNMEDISGLLVKFEEDCYDVYLQSLGSDCKFVKIIENGDEVPGETSQGVCQGEGEGDRRKESLSVPQPPLQPKKKKRISKTARQRRGLTPIYKRRGFNKTHKNIKFE